MIAELRGEHRADLRGDPRQIRDESEAPVRVHSTSHVPHQFMKIFGQHDEKTILQFQRAPTSSIRTRISDGAIAA